MRMGCFLSMSSVLEPSLVILLNDSSVCFGSVCHRVQDGLSALATKMTYFSKLILGQNVVDLAHRISERFRHFGSSVCLRWGPSLVVWLSS